MPQKGKLVNAERPGPVQEFKMGRIVAKIWRNQGDNKEPWFSVTVVRTYKSQEGWRESSSFNRDDLPVVTLAANMAYEWIWMQQGTSRP